MHTSKSEAALRNFLTLNIFCLNAIKLSVKLAAFPFPLLQIADIFVGKQTISSISGFLMALSSVGDREAHSCVDELPSLKQGCVEFK